MNKTRTKKLGRRGLIVLAVLLVSATLVGATLLTFFGEIETTMTVEQSVMIDGNGWDEPVAHSIEAIGGCTYCFEHTILNQGCQGIWLDWLHTGTPNMEGIDITMTQESPCHLDYITLEVLDGIADDSFELYVDEELVYTYTDEEPINDPETWIEHEIDLSPYEIVSCMAHEIKIVAIGPQWEQFETYGQLGVNQINLYVNDKLCNEVNIGNESSEAGIPMEGWGPIEPATSGGNWGGIDDCRAVWIDGDEPWATVELTCTCCPGEVEMETPFYLESGESIDFSICYELDMLIAPGTYHIYSTLVPATI